ncbi:MAG: TonB-dependent receptor [Acidobacteria bacterium]|nr:TonB-dependent receptor [Acidobacteriota bacterium]
MTSAAGVSYTYDADNRRVNKSNGKLYWYGVGGEVLAESDLSGTITAEYIYFNGARIAKRVPSIGAIYYYLSDRLGTARVITDASGSVVPDAVLTVRNLETGQTRTAKSAADGSYRFAALPVGPYEVKAEHPGFQSELRGGVGLTGVEGIREYRVVTNSFSTEYGMTMGSQMVIVSKGGTNSFHGSVFEYLRNDNLDARNFFDRITSLTRGRLPEFKRNNFGASFGGPIRKDKTFFFTVYEGVRQRLGLTTLLTVIPTAAKQDGGLVPQIAPAIKPLLALYPDPNLPRNEFTFPFSQPTREDYGQERVDHVFSASDSAFGRYTIHDTELVRPEAYPQFQTASLNRLQYGTLSEIHVFSPTLLNTFRFSYSRTNTQQISPTDLKGPQYSFVPGREIGSISITGINTLGPGGTSPIQGKQNIFTWSNDLFYTRAQHSWKLGVLINRYQQYFLNSSNAKGSISFANLTDFLQARPQNYSAITPGSILDRSYYYSTFGFYAQDDWRLSSRLTLNLGVRYEFQTAAEEIRGLGSNVRDLRRDATATIGQSFKNPSLKNVSPRIGFAWDVAGDGKTAIRGGFGLLYDLGNLGSVLIISAVGTPPFTSQSQVNLPSSFTLPLAFPAEAVGKRLRLIDYDLQQPHLLQYNLAVERQLPWNAAVTLAYGGSRGLNLFQGREGNPTVPQILPDGRKFWLGNEPLINPNWSNIELKTAGGNSFYNSLQLGLTKRLSRGLQFQNSYTFSKLIDEGQSQLNSDNNAVSSFLVDTSDPKLDRAPSVFDATHNFRFNGIYRFSELASGGMISKLLNGWWVSGILTLQSGYPFTPVLGTNRSRSKMNGGAAGIDRPDLVSGRNGSNIVLGGSDRYFDSTAFRIPAAGFLGTAGRNIVRGPGFATVDFSLSKDTSLDFLGEGGKLEFRAEVFNITNHANFALPNRTVFAARQDVEAPVANAGRIDSTSSTSRQIQFALKLLF